MWSYAPSAAGTHRFDNWSITLLGGGQRPVKVLAKAAARPMRAVLTPPALTTWRSYYFANGRPVAMRVVGDQGASNVLYVLHQDHLGSTSLVTSITGTVVSQQWYYPYGETRAISGTVPTTLGFTGQRRDEGVGSLMFYQARYYSPALSRFVSADTIVPGARNPQALNRYSYVLNAPLKHTDPSGHCSISVTSAFGTVTVVLPLPASVCPGGSIEIGGIGRDVLDVDLAEAGPDTPDVWVPDPGVDLPDGTWPEQGPDLPDFDIPGWETPEFGLQGTGKTAAFHSRGHSSDSEGPFAKNGIEVEPHFYDRLEAWGISEEQAYQAYKNGRRFTDEEGKWIIYDPKTKIGIRVDSPDGDPFTVFEQDNPSRTWEPGWAVD